MQQYPPTPMLMEGKWKSNNIVEVAPNCPRCASSDTKFCYYNNYSFSQPRYFCKGCKRYWTKGGSLRNVPVGGGCRKNRRLKSAKPSFHSHRMGPCDSLTSSPRKGSQPTEIIDMAAVFAKYLNQGSGLENKVSGEESSSTGANSSSDETLGPLNKFQEQSGSVEEVLFLGRLPNVFDPKAYELQKGISDGLVQESLWQDCTRVQDLAWQPVGKFQEFESFSSVDQLGVSTNLISDSWSSFDFSDYEFFQDLES